MSMKREITDLFDDIPVELLDEIVQKGNGHGRKKGIYIPKWTAVLVIGFSACLQERRRVRGDQAPGPV